MRQWLVDPRCMCRKHLFGEHVESHMLIGHGKLKRKVGGYLRGNLFEPLITKIRHDELSLEMLKRGFKHQTPLEENPVEIFSYLSPVELNWTIDKDSAKHSLVIRCPECRKNIEEKENNPNWQSPYHKAI